MRWHTNVKFWLDTITSQYKEKLWFITKIEGKGKLKHLLHHSNGLGGQANRLRKTFLQDLPRELSMLSSLHQAEQDHAHLG